MVRITTFGKSKLLPVDFFETFRLNHVKCSSNWLIADSAHTQPFQFYSPYHVIDGWFGFARFLLELREIVNQNSSFQLSVLYVWIAADENRFSYEFPSQWLKFISEVSDEVSFEVCTDQHIGR